MIEAVIFDLDGVLIDSESVWDSIRRSYAELHGGRWTDTATRDMMGMSSTEWSQYMCERLGVQRPPDRISSEVAERVRDSYRNRLPLIEGAADAVERLAARWPLGLASSANRDVIDLVLERSGLSRLFATSVSSEEVAQGKPAPDVYLEAARRLSVEPPHCAAIEDSHNGILSASAAGMHVIAIPNATFPPGEDALGAAALVVPSIRKLTVETVDVAQPGAG